METIGDWDNSWGRFFMYLAMMTPFAMLAGFALFGGLWKLVNWLFAWKAAKKLQK